MAAQRRGRTRFHDRPFESGSHGGTLVLAIDEHERARHAQEERHGEGKGARRHLVQRGKRSIVYLLHAADFVEFHGPHVARVGEIADRRIDEGQVAVLADPHDHQAGRSLLQESGVAFAFSSGIGCFTIQLMECRYRNVVEEAVAEKASEGRRMVRGHSGIFVHVEGGEAGPIDLVSAQCGKEGVLRHGGGEDDRRAPGPLDFRPYYACGDLRARRTGCGLVREGPHVEPVPGELLMIWVHGITIAFPWRRVWWPGWG